MNFFKKAARGLAEHAEDAARDLAADLSRQASVSSQNDAHPASGPRAVTVDGVELSDAQFEEKVKTAIPGMVRMFSGCHDTQTSADVSNTSSFQLPTDAGPGGAGGAATNSHIATLTHDGGSGAADMTWVQILESMRKILSTKGYEQVPQLSASRSLDLANGKFSFLNPEAKSGSKRRALLVGINYVGQRGELSGCHNDVVSMRMYLEKHGFSRDEMRILMDDGEAESPTAANLVAAFDWLSDGAEAGDSLVFHYSGHGGYVADDSGDEADGRDETLVPLDFQEAGQLRDDLVFKELVLPVPAGVQLSCIMDCCHSGSVLDLPYTIKASEHLDAATAQMEPNPGFSFKKLFAIAMKLYQMKNGGADNSTLAKQAAGDIFPLLGGANKAQGGLANLMALAGGALGGSGGSGGASGSGASGLMSSMPSLPF